MLCGRGCSRGLFGLELVAQFGTALTKRLGRRQFKTEWTKEHLQAFKNDYGRKGSSDRCQTTVSCEASEVDMRTFANCHVTCFCHLCELHERYIIFIFFFSFSYISGVEKR